MGKQYSIAEARDQLARLVHTAESGEPVTLTRRGRPVAVLLSEREFAKLSTVRRGFWEAYEELRRATPDWEDVEPGVFEGVRAGEGGRPVDL